MNQVPGKNNPPVKQRRIEDTDHSVIIHFFYGQESLDPLLELEEKMRSELETSGVGLCDGHEVAMDDSDGFYFLYGENAESVFKTVAPILAQSAFMKGATALLSFGPTGQERPQIEVYVDTQSNF
jgi:hypothetical protein